MVRDVLVHLLGMDGPAMREILLLLLVPAAYCAHVRWVERRSIDELALRRAAPELGLGFLLGFALIAAVLGIVAVLGTVSVAAGAGMSALALGSLLALGTAVWEEIIIRGIVFRILEEGLGTWIALALTALLFGLLHLGNDNATIWGGLAIALTAGLVLAGVYVLTHRLWLAIGVHLAVNWSQGPLFGLPVSGGEKQGVFQTSVAGPTWLTGGEFGIEASIPLLILGLAVAVAVLHRAHRKGKFMPPVWRRSLRTGGIYLGKG
jgi:hypothetical protein